MNNYIQTGGYQAVNRSGEKSESNIENKAVLENMLALFYQGSISKVISSMLVTVKLVLIRYTTPLSIYFIQEAVIIFLTTNLAYQANQ